MSSTTTAVDVRHNVPVALTPLIGRETACAQLVAQLRDPACRLVTITGSGGVGKSRVALHVAQAFVPVQEALALFSHGIYVVPMVAFEAQGDLDDALATAVAIALQVTLSGAETALIQVLQYVREKALLLVFDNLEHVPAATPVIAKLLQEAPALKIIVTARERLRLWGEWVFELGPLPVPPPGCLHSAGAAEHYSAVQLFIATAQRVTATVPLTPATLAAVVHICELVEGLPLGLELAASWSHVLSFTEIAGELDRNLDFLQAASPTVPPHQRSLRAVFEYSWTLLNSAEQQTLRQLSVFRGSFTREAAAIVASAALPLLTSLVEKSLVHRIPPSASKPGGRFEVLEMVRHYAAEQLEQAGDATQTLAQFTSYYLNMLAAMTGDLRGARQIEALATIEAEIDHVRAAWRLAVAQQAGGLIACATDSLFHFYDMRSWFGEGAEVFRFASAAFADASAEHDGQLVWGKVMARQGWFTFHLGRQHEARALLEQSVTLLRTLGAEGELVFALNYLAAICSYLGEYDITSRLCLETIALTERLDDPYSRAVACNILGQSAYNRGEYPVARTWSQRSLAIEQQIGNRWSMAYSLTNLGKVAYSLGEYGVAQQLFEQSLRIREETGDLRGVAICLNQLGDTAVKHSSPAEAAGYYQQSLALFREIGNQWGMASALINLGTLSSTTKDPAATIRIFEEALRLALETGAMPVVATILRASTPLLRGRVAGPWVTELEQAGTVQPHNPATLQSHAVRLLQWIDAERASGALPALTIEQATTTVLEASRDMASQRSVLVPPDPTGRTKHLYGLTPREVEVLRLVAQGLTDAEVAIQLTLSTRTVSTHLSSIYGKLNISSRGAATRFAVEHGLT